MSISEESREYRFSLGLLVRQRFRRIFGLAKNVNLISSNVQFSLSFSLASSQNQYSPLRPNSFNDSSPPSPLKEHTKSQYLPVLYQKVQRFGLFETSIEETVSLERLKRHYVHQ